MKLVTYSAKGAQHYGAVVGDRVLSLSDKLGQRYPDLKSLIAHNGFAEAEKALKDAGPGAALDSIAFEPVIPNPTRILCVGLNYESHRLETGRPIVGHPTLFLRFASSQTGHKRPMIRPLVSTKFDYEGELVVIIGKPGRYIPLAETTQHIAGYSIYNEGSIRDWQNHTSQFSPGKNFPATGAFGPWMVTADEVPDPRKLRLTTRLNGQVMQDAGIDQMIFPIPNLISYCSAFTPLEPGDIIVTGTPGGVGFKREPPVFMTGGDSVEVEITGIGTLINRIEDEKPGAGFTDCEFAHMAAARQLA
jgi:2-keto-4-pentenoate hydratase/2-oxohepta-3-ene-1,7-dioic acid hydratase in catechol pathway